MREPLKAIIFDFDYTLADPTRGMDDCLDFAIDHLGLPRPPAEIIAQTVGLSLRASFGHLAGPDHSGRCEEFIQLVVQRADETMNNLTVLFETVRPTVKQLKAQGIVLGIVSMKYREHFLPVLQEEKLSEAF